MWVHPPVEPRTTLWPGGNMPASFMKKTMAYLGLVDDDYDDFDDFEPRTSSNAPVGRTGQRPMGGIDEIDFE